MLKLQIGNKEEILDAMTDTEPLRMRSVPLVERPVTSLVVHIEEDLCIENYRPNYKRTSMLVCKAYDTLVGVSCTNNTMAHFVQPPKEIMPKVEMQWAQRSYRQHLMLWESWQQITGAVNTEF